MISWYSAHIMAFWLCRRRQLSVMSQGNVTGSKFLTLFLHTCGERRVRAGREGKKEEGGRGGGEEREGERREREGGRGGREGGREGNSV